MFSIYLSVFQPFCIPLLRVLCLVLYSIFLDYLFFWWPISWVLCIFWRSDHCLMWGWWRSFPILWAIVLFYWPCPLLYRSFSVSGGLINCFSQCLCHGLYLGSSLLCHAFECASHFLFCINCFAKIFVFTHKALSQCLVELKGWLMARFCFRRDWGLGRSLEQERAETCIFDHLRKPVGHRMMSRFSWVLKQKGWLSQKAEKFKYGNSDKLRTGSLLGMFPERSPRINASWKHNKQNVAYASKNPET